MCTIAWGQRDGQLWVCFNRDEQDTRPQAEPPFIRGRAGERLAYALDPVGMGSWFVASERGFVVALLNHYPDNGHSHHGSGRSRGQVVLELARLKGLDEAARHVDKLPLGDYAAFDLVLLSPGEVVTRCWNGSVLQDLSCPGNFWTTSSHVQEPVRAWRTRWWRDETRNRILDAESAGDLMQQAFPEQPEYGITMDRDTARTVSQIRVRMAPDGFLFSYYPRAGKRAGYSEPVNLRCPD